MLPFIPDGYRPLSDLVDAVGRRQFGKRWDEGAMTLAATKGEPADVSISERSENSESEAKNHTNALRNSEDRRQTIILLIRKMLWDGNCSAFALINGQICLIPSSVWAVDDVWSEIEKNGRINCIVRSEEGWGWYEDVEYRGPVIVKDTDVLSERITKGVVETAAEARNSCEELLRQLVERSPDPIKKDHCFDAILPYCNPRVSRRGFDNTWASSKFVPLRWRKPGPRSPRRPAEEIMSEIVAAVQQS